MARVRRTGTGSGEAGDRWEGSDRIVQVRPHVWRWLSGRLDGRAVLELGPGLRPTIPAERGTFVEVSPHVREVLSREGARTLPPEELGGLPDDGYSAVLAFEVLEHIEDDEGVVQAVARILRPGGAVVISTPIRQALWSPLDEACGHVRRYEPEDLFGLLRRHGLRVEGFVATGGVLRHIDGLRARFMRRNPRAVTAWVQRLVFPTQAWFHRLFGSLRWRSAQDPVPGGADGILVWARKADGETRATRSG
jgi:SAM-dependent methyltransferase